MALGASTIWQVNGGTATAGNLNGGGFNIANANFLTDYVVLLATGNAPTISSVSYAFQATDVSAWVYIKAGTAMTSGFYKITAVNGGVATLNATVGAAVQLKDDRFRYSANTVAGCGTGAGPWTAVTAGIDYSQGDTAIINDTDLAVADGDAAAPACTSVNKPFGVNHVGNHIHVTAGTGLTVGWYEIVSVLVVTASLDRAVGTDGAKTNGTFYVGGALSMGASDDQAVLRLGLAGNIIYMKGTVTGSVALNITTNGTAALNVTFEGMVTIRGDRPTGASRPQWDIGTNTFSSGNWWILRNLTINSTAAAGVYTINMGTSAKMIDCQIRNHGGGTCIWPTGNNLIMNCELSSYGYAQYGIQVQGTSQVIGCYIHSCDIGIHYTGTGAPVIANNIIANCKTSAINLTGNGTGGGTLIYGNTLYGTEVPRGTGLAMSTGVTNIRVINNIFYGFVSAITHADSQTNGFDNFNCFFNNTTDVVSGNWNKGKDDIALTPAFASVSQITGTNGTTAAGILTSSGADFSTVTNNQDFLYVSAGTGVTVGFYLITAHTTTTLTTSPVLANNATADKVFSICKGHNFKPGANVKDVGFPGIFSFPVAANTQAYSVIGAVTPQSTDPGASKVKSGTSYTFFGTTTLGTLPTVAGGGGFKPQFGG